MASEILTPKLVWEDFELEHEPIVEHIGEYKSGNVIISRFYLHGRTVGKEVVKIYCSLARDLRYKTLPGVFVVQDFLSGADESFITYLASKGYAAITFDLAGSEGLKGNRTIYPQDISYANYENSRQSLRQISGSVKKSCWYEWGTTARYVLDYFSKLSFVKAIGAVGQGDAANVVWHIASGTNIFKCMATIMNCGWSAYKNINKFSGNADIEFSDEAFKYIAGIELQTYAPHINCPSIMLVPTNGSNFDVDRAYDTISRIKENVYTIIDYSLKFRNSISYDGVCLAEMFFDKFLKGKKSVNLPSKLEIDGEIKDGKLTITAYPDTNNLKEVYAYVSEGMVCPELRTYRQIKCEKKLDDGSYTFSYTPYAESGITVFFARAVYKNGASVSSPILARKFTPNESSLKYKSNVVYTSRESLAESIFTCAMESRNTPMSLNLTPDNAVNFEMGPLGIGGVSCFGGVLTFIPGTSRFKPKDDSICMLDVFVKEDSELTVKLIANYFNARKEYVTKVALRGGNVWHNVKLQRQDFKTEEGLPLKSFNNIDALEIDALGIHLINNILWV